MSKKCIFIIIFFFILNFYAVSLGVEILTDSPNTMLTRIQEFYDRLEMILHMVNQGQQFVEMLQHQAKVIENLAEGDFDGFLDALDEQARVISRFSDLLDGFDYYYDEFEITRNLIDDPEFDILKLDVKALENSMRASSKFMHSSLNLVKNTEYRLEKHKELKEKSKVTDSVVGQLQLTNENLSLMDATIQDLMTATLALNNAIAIDIENSEIKKKYEERVADEVFIDIENDDEIFKPKVDMDDYWDAIMGGEVVDIE